MNKNNPSTAAAIISTDGTQAKPTSQAKQAKTPPHPFRHLVFAPTVTRTVFQRHLLLQSRALEYAMKRLKPPTPEFIAQHRVDLWQREGAHDLTLYLDLDETLIHTCELEENPQEVISLSTPEGYAEELGINVRPYCQEFLEKCSEFYEIYAFTASTLPYATMVTQHIDPEGKWFRGILHRANCTETMSGLYIKDLRIAGQRDPDKALIIDNLAGSFAWHIPNGIPIVEYHNDPRDKELKHLIPYLTFAAKQPDIVAYNTRKMKLQELLDQFVDPDD